MRMIPVSSSNVSRIGYAFDSRRRACDGTLYVQFKRNGDPNGPLYAYDDVPYTVYVGMLAANSNEGGSVGKFLNEHVKKVGYEYRRVE